MTGCESPVEQLTEDSQTVLGELRGSAGLLRTSGETERKEDQMTDRFNKVLDRNFDGVRTQEGRGRAGPGGHARGAEKELTGETAAKVKEAALGELDGATVDRVETDAEGKAAYEAHVTKADGSRTTVYVDQNFDVVEVETGR